MPDPSTAPATTLDLEQERKPSLWRRWVINPIVHQLTQGTSPRQISLALAYGLGIGIFPFIGVTSIMALVIGIPLKLNQPILQSFKSLIGPLQWVLIVPFYRAGEVLFGAPRVSLSVPAMVEKFSSAPVAFLTEYGRTVLYGATAWGLVAPFLVVAAYYAVRPLIEGLNRGLKKGTATV